MPSESWWPAPSMPRGRRPSTVCRSGFGAHREGRCGPGGRSGPHRPFLCGGGGATRRRSRRPDADPLLEPGRGRGAGSGRGRAGLGAGAAAHVRAVLGGAGPGAGARAGAGARRAVRARPGRCRGRTVPDVELAARVPVEVDVVAALATSAPPARRPEVSAPTARTLRKRICMAVVPFSCLCSAGPVRAGTADSALRICARPQSDVDGCDGVVRRTR